MPSRITIDILTEVQRILTQDSKNFNTRLRNLSDKFKEFSDSVSVLVAVMRAKHFAQIDALRKKCLYVKILWEIYHLPPQAVYTICTRLGHH